jgi:two-component system, OmpR family, sensor kinase
MFESVRARLTLWYVSVLALVLIGFCFGLYALLSRALYARVDEGLLALIEITTKSLTNDIDEGQTVEGSAHSTVTELVNPQQAIAVFDGAGQLLAENTLGEDFHPQLPPLHAIPSEVLLYTVPEREGVKDDFHRVGVKRVNVASAQVPYIILINQPLDPIEDELELLRRLLYYTVPIALLMAGLGGWLLAHKSLAPVVDMADRARQIGSQNLDQRLPVANPRDELGRLASTFNELLARLNDSFAQQRQFMADASHELRTPLTVMHAAADVTLKQPHRDEAEYREAITMLDQQAKRLARIVNDMFVLARADTGRYPLRKTALYLNDLVEEVAQAGSVLAVNKGIRVERNEATEISFHGDEDLLRQMLLTLVDNAVRWTPEGGVISLNLRQENNSFLISVSDTGPGIPVEAQPHIFERFYRADKSRSRRETDGGAGLGLSIASWIAQAHGGSLTLESSGNEGTTFVARLPVESRNPLT